jgi:hypothetical protein
MLVHPYDALQGRTAISELGDAIGPARFRRKDLISVWTAAALFALAPRLPTGWSDLLRAIPLGKWGITRGWSFLCIGTLGEVNPSPAQALGWA